MKLLSVVKTKGQRLKASQMEISSCSDWVTFPKENKFL